MKVITDYIPLSTKGFTDIIDVTGQVAEAIHRSGISSGTVTVFISGSTAGVTTIEYEPGLLQDLPEAFEKIAPMDARYNHDAHGMMAMAFHMFGRRCSGVRSLCRSMIDACYWGPGSRSLLSILTIDIVSVRLLSRSWGSKA